MDKNMNKVHEKSHPSNGGQKSDMPMHKEHMPENNKHSSKHAAPKNMGPSKGGMKK